MSRKRSTKRDQLDRINTVQALLVKGHDYTSIVRFCMSNWDVSESTAKRYIREARAMVKLSVDGLDDQLALQHARLLSLLHQNQGDIKVSLKILDQITKLLDLKSKHLIKEVKDVRANQSSTLPDEDSMAALLKEIEATETAQ
ncbi:MAG: hypothetical protein KC475_00350 [Cyanobacteria bacterium HKST-UBA03]|nr:hypothetical protein [Cyanobacteria bacterium HKST-UBA05]MCA9840539.1 hypothetical protein [Cyanobacteria bacterium HKST-UBA03]